MKLGKAIEENDELRRECKRRIGAFRFDLCLMLWATQAKRKAKKMMKREKAG